MKVFARIAEFFNEWRSSESGLAAVEAAMVFPILMTLLLGTFDMGNAILTNQKTIRASQIAADLISRHKEISVSELDDAIEASRLAFQPMDGDSYGVDIVSVSFNDEAEAEIEWRETQNMNADPDILDRVESLAQPNDGVLIVSVQYMFEPVFASFIVDQIPMQEIAFTRGRQTAVITME